MGYFDGLVSGAFKKDAAGHTVFYPWGILGKGYVVPSVVEEERLRSFLKTMYMILLPGIIIIQVVFGAWVNFVIVIPVYIACCKCSPIVCNSVAILHKMVLV